MKSPDFRIEELTDGEKPLTPNEEEFVKIINKKKNIDSDVQYAYDIYLDKYKSEVIEAFILSGGDDVFIEKLLRVPSKVSAIYRSLFFRQEVFRDELDVEAYVHTYDEDEYGKEIKLCAVTLGKEYLIFRFNKDPNSELDVSGAMKSMVEASYMLSKATKINPLNSASSKEARQWMGMALKSLETYAKIKPSTESNSDDFKLALENIDRTTNESKSDIKKETIVH